jgi:osmotically inducible protein OsmC
MATISKASAVWNGKLRDGNGVYEAATGSFKGAYSFPTRFEGKPGTNPEELLAAAHAACFSMALAAGLEKAGTPATRIATIAHCTMDSVAGTSTVAKMRLETRGVVPGINQAAFQTAADGAKQNCPVSRALAGIPTVELVATLES